MSGRRWADITVIVAILGMAGCDSAGTEVQSTPVPSGIPAPGAPGGTPPAEPSKESRRAWTPSLKPKTDTLYLGQGELPNSVIDKTTASVSGRLVVRVECQGGKFVSTIEVDLKKAGSLIRL